MEADFWHQRWANNQIGFHQLQAHDLLVKYIGELNLNKGDVIFVPLCGKTLDIGWLLDQGYRVIGSELSELAVEQLFEDLELQAEVSGCGGLKRYAANNIEIYVGDFFSLEKKLLGRVDAVYDRAALVALPLDMRIRYKNALMELTDRARQLLIVLEYDQEIMSGPPFSLSGDDIEDYYQDAYQCLRLETVFLKQGLKGVMDVDESVYRLEPR